MRRTLNFTSKLVLPTITSELETLPVRSRFVLDTSKMYSLQMTFLPSSENEVVWYSSISMLTDAFAGTTHQGDIIFSVDVSAREVTLLLDNREGTAELLLPYQPLEDAITQARAAGFRPWQFPEITDEAITLLLQEAE